jgi:lysozyme
MKTSINGINLIKKYEGCKLQAYLCPSGIPTIGMGNTFYKNGSKIKLGDKITQQQAEELLMDLLPQYEAIVNKNIKIDLTQYQFDALVSFAWNCGKSEALFKLVNSKSKDLKQWWETHYTTGGGKVLQGLVNRRKEEAELFFKL